MSPPAPRAPGLGLAIVRKIMEDHGGTSRLADAEDGEGAVVTLTFPFKAPKSTDQKNTAAKKT